MSEVFKLTDHNKIRQWLETQGAHPAVIKGTSENGSIGVLRLDFDGLDENLQRIGWGEFFDAFDSRKFALVAQEKIEGRRSRLVKFVER